jgi:hypothetical protein
MSQVIKFNAWDKFEKKMILWKDMIKDKESEKLIVEILLNNERYIPLQYIGEISFMPNNDLYAGDLVKFDTWYKKEIIESIKFEEGRLYPFYDDEYIQDEQGNPYYHESFVKVGNVYEGLKIDL